MDGVGATGGFGEGEGFGELWRDGVEKGEADSDEN